ncbi:MAG: flavodoxin family protein [Thermoprotei archaeon]|nr:flavodoxin family protein [Thermoprotei archaeon]
MVIYVSIHHGNTERVAKVIAKVLGATLAKPSEVSVETLSEYDLMGFGSGVYYGRHHKSLLDLVDKLPDMRGKRAFIFSTSGLRRIPFIHDFSKQLRKKLEERGFEIIGEFSCRGFTTHWPFNLIGGINKGRSNEEDLKRAEAFAREMRNRFRRSRACRLWLVAMGSSM